MRLTIETTNIVHSNALATRFLKKSQLILSSNEYFVNILLA